MNTKIAQQLARFFGFISILAIAPIGAETSTISESDARDIAVEAYIYGYPLITMDLTKQVMTNTSEPGHNKAPMGQFYNASEYPNASFKDVTAPNADTLYSTAWLDLSKEPYILHVPNEDGRYYLMPLLSAWTEVFAVPGTRTTGSKEADFAITGPGWKGTLPKGVTEFKSPTALVWVLGRTYSTGTPQDYEAVHKLQAQYSLTPLSAYGKSYTPPKGVLNPAIDVKTPVREQVNKLTAEVFFNRLALLMKDNPPTPDDSQIVAKMSRIGIIPGKNFSFSQLDPKIVKAIQQAPKLALEKILAQEKVGGKLENDWLVTVDTGNYGQNYLQRAYITYVGLGANKPQDAIYPMTQVDADKKPLNGKNKYVIHFDKDKTPPVKGFWSLTMYNSEFYFVQNPLNRYTLSPRNQLKYNPDGSLDLYIQNANPGKEKEANWLPAPEGPFALMFRFYWPEESIIKGSWIPPKVTKTNN